MRSTLILSFAGLAAAHFRLLHPESAHFDDSSEDQAPCGGRIPSFPSNDDDLFQYHIGGEDIATELTHEASNWLIRVTTDQKASKGWEQVIPIYAQSGLGRFCQPKVALPSKYEGKTGIISVVSEATDGILYQCIQAKFVSGTGDDFDKCSNGSATGYATDSPKLSALVNGSDDGSSDSGSKASETTTSGGSKPTGDGDDEQNDDDGAAVSMQAWGLMSTAVTVTAMALLSGALLV
ncbi:expression library immunization antigen 1 [Sarocladium implicatum]|nr:expression library immunization antigen 1 [Sarocladium implicatum]